MHFPATQAGSDEGKTKAELRRSIPLRPDGTHLAASDVRHADELATTKFISKISFHKIALCASVTEDNGKNESIGLAAEIRQTFLQPNVCALRGLLAGGAGFELELPRDLERSKKVELGLYLVPDRHISGNHGKGANRTAT